MKLIPILTNHNTVSSWTQCILFSLIISVSSCESFLEVDLAGSEITGEVVFSDDITANSAMTGVYYDMLNYEFFSSGSNLSITSLASLSADELLNYPRDPSFVEFETNELRADNSNIRNLWGSAYKIIYECNAIINGIASSSTLSESIKSQIEGEALLVRSFSYFYLVNLFGEVPMLTTTDYTINTTTRRDSVSVVYRQILSDLVRASNILSDEYVTTERVRPNKSTVMALLARVYLYLGDWSNAELYSTNVINNNKYSISQDIASVFGKNSSEAIWQLRPVLPGYPTYEASYFVIEYEPYYNVIRDDFVHSFENDDERRNQWIGEYITETDTFYFPNKYKLVYAEEPAEYSMVFRLAEQYLIRAEARAHIGIDLAKAIADLDSIRSRAGLPMIRDLNPGISQSDLLLAIEQERKIELFTEWGHRWLDLKRTNRTKDILAIEKDSWSKQDELYPVPQSEINKNTRLKPQNPGY